MWYVYQNPYVFVIDTGANAHAINLMEKVRDCFYIKKYDTLIEHSLQ